MNSLPMMISQLASQTPMILVFVTGTVIALANYRRWPRPAMLCLLGCGISLLTIFMVAILQASLFEQRSTQNWTSERYGQILAVVGLAGGLARAVGLGLLLGAVFVGRSKVEHTDEFGRAR